MCLVSGRQNSGFIPVWVDVLFFRDRSASGGPSSAAGPIFWCSWERRFGSFGAFQHPRPLPLAPNPKPPPSIARGQKRYFIEMSLLHYWSKLAKLSPLGEDPKQKDQKVSSPSSPHPPLQLHSNVWTHLVTRTICKSGLGTTLWTVPTQDI